MKFFSGTVFGVFLTVLGLYGSVLYLKSPTAQLNRCVSLYMSADLANEPAIVDAMKQGNFGSVEELVADRCKTWISNGQRF